MNSSQKMSCPSQPTSSAIPEPSPPALEGETIYLAGAMAGTADHGMAQFEEATTILRNRGVKVVSPHENVADADQKLAVEMGAEWRTTQQYREYLLRDLRLVSSCDRILLLPGWETSAGVRVEVVFANAVGIPTTPWDSIEHPEPR